MVDLLNLPPSKISFSGKASLNAGGFKGYNDFIVKGSAITVGYEVELPMSIRTNSIVIDQIAENALFKIENDSIKSLAIGGVKPEQLEYIDLIFKIDNGIPFDGNIDVFFADRDSVINDSILVGTLMQSAIADANGKTSKNVTTVSSVRLTPEKIKDIQDKNLTNMVVRVTIRPYFGNVTAVKLYSSYVSRIGMSAKLKLKYKVNNK